MTSSRAKSAGLALAVALCSAAMQPAISAQEEEPKKPGSADHEGPQTTPDARRYYLGGPQSDQKGTGSTDAERDPTSILIGPYLPEGSITAPDFEEVSDDIHDTVPDLGEFGQDAPSASGEGAHPIPSEEDAETESDISVARLSGLDPAAIGAWPDNAPTAPFPVDMWQGTERTQIGTLLSALPDHIGSPTLRSLARRLLLSPASLPAEPVEEARLNDPFLTFGSQEPASSTDGVQIDGIESERLESGSLTEEDPEKGPGQDILTARLEALYALAEIDGFLALSEHLGETANDGDLAQMHSDALLISGDYDAACTMARDMVGTSGAAYWLRSIALCDALDGNREGAYFQLSLLNEAQESNPAFNGLIEALVSQIEGRDVRPEALDLGGIDALTPIVASAIWLGGFTLPDSLALKATPQLLPNMIRSPNVAVETRLALTERAARLGLLDDDVLADVFSELTFDDNDRDRVFEAIANENETQRVPDTGQRTGGQSRKAGPAASDETVTQVSPPPLPSGMRLHGLLYRLAADASDPAERIRWIEIALEHARQHQLTLPVARALGGPLSAISPDPALAGYADSAARVHLLNNQPEKAMQWYEAARNAAQAGNVDARRAVSALWPVMLVGSPEGTLPYRSQILELWWQAHQDLASPETVQSGERLFTILSDLGYDVPSSMLDQVITAPKRSMPAPSSALWRRHIKSIHMQRFGETVLTSLVGIGEHMPGSVNSSYMLTVIAGLRQLGLDAEARRLACEILIAEGF